MYDDIEDFQAAEEYSESQKKNEGANVIKIQSTGLLMPDIKPYNIELSVFLDKKSIYNGSVKSSVFIYKNCMSEAHHCAFKAADRLKKIADCVSLKTSIKIGSQKPWLYTLKDSTDMGIIERQI